MTRTTTPPIGEPGGPPPAIAPTGPVLPMAGPPAPPPAPAPAPPPEADGDLEALARRLDEAQAKMPELDPYPRQLLNEHLDALAELHRSGLRTIVRTLRDDPRGKELLFELVDDPAVRMIFALNGVIRSGDPDPVAQAEQVLTSIRPGIASHGGDVQLDRIEGGIAYVRLSGACNGCSMAGVTARQGVEKALVEQVPSITAVEVVPNDPEPAAPALAVTQVAADGTSSTGGVGSAPPGAGAGWFKTFPVERVAPGTLEALSLQPTEGESVEVVVVHAAGKLAAYVNACAHQGMPLDNAIVDGEQGTITCPWHGFSFDATSGECLTMPGAQLEPLPLRVQDDHVWVRASA